MVKQSDWELLKTLYNNRSITKTARELYMTQPAVTKRLHQLEDYFHVHIAHRTASGLEFTEQGVRLAQFSEQMVRQYGEFQMQLHQETAEPSGKLHLAASNSLTRFVLPGLLGAYHKVHPKVEFEVTSAFSYQVSQLVNTRKTQIGFLRGEHPHSCCRVRLRQQQACVVSSSPFQLEDLPDMPRIDFRADPFTSATIDGWWYRHFSEAPNTAMTVGTGSTCFEMVRHGLGYGIFLSEDFIWDRTGLTILPLLDEDGLPLTRTDWMIYREQSMELDAVRSFVEFSKTYFSGEPV